jgi:hypothetical protein
MRGAGSGSGSIHERSADGGRSPGSEAVTTYSYQVDTALTLIAGRLTRRDPKGREGSPRLPPVAVASRALRKRIRAVNRRCFDLRRCRGRRRRERLQDVGEVRVRGRRRSPTPPGGVPVKAKDGPAARRIRSRRTSALSPDRFQSRRWCAGSPARGRGLAPRPRVRAARPTPQPLVVSAGVHAQRRFLSGFASNWLRRIPLTRAGAQWDQPTVGCRFPANFSRPPDRRAA